VPLCSAAVGACSRGSWEAAILLLFNMQIMRMQPPLESYGDPLQACGNAGQWFCALVLLGDMRRQGFMPNKYHFAKAINACRHAKQWTWALHTFGEMVEAEVHPDSMIYRSILRVMAGTTSRDPQQAKWMHALALFKQMQLDSHLLAEGRPCALLIDSCGHAGKWPWVLHLFRHFGGRWSITRSAAVKAFCHRKAQHWPLALELLVERYWEADDATPSWNHLIVTVAKVPSDPSRWQKVLSFLKEMSQRGLDVMAETYAWISEACEACYCAATATGIFPAAATATAFSKLVMLAASGGGLSSSWRSFRGSVHPRCGACLPKPRRRARRGGMCTRSSRPNFRSA